jgi:hypothetical protein
MRHGSETICSSDELCSRSRPDDELSPITELGKEQGLLRCGRSALLSASILAAVCVLLVLSAQHLSSSTQGRSNLLGSCSDSTICSRYALLRSVGARLGSLRHRKGTAGVQTQPADLENGRESAHRSSSVEDDEIATGGFSLPYSLVTAPVVAAEHLVQREARAELGGVNPFSSGPSMEQSKSAGLPEFRAGQVVHISTSQGQLPLFVDGQADAAGDVPVHGFRQGVKYQGFIRIGQKAKGISYPRTADILHAMYKTPKGTSASETRVSGSMQLHGAADEQVKVTLAMVPDSGVMTTVNTRAMPSPQGALQFNPNFVHGIPGAPHSLPAPSSPRAIAQRAQQQQVCTCVATPCLLASVDADV